MDETGDAALHPRQEGASQRTGFLWFVLVFVLVVVVPVAGFEAAASYESTRCSTDYPEGECDLAGVAGIAAVFLVYAVEAALVLLGFLVWVCFRLVRRVRTPRTASTHDTAGA